MHGTMLNAEDRARPVRRCKHDWTLKEHEVVVDHWPDIDTIGRLLPHRTRSAIQSFAGKCNLRREQHYWTTTENAQLKRLVKAKVPRKQIAKEMGLTLNQVVNRMAYTNIRYERCPPQSSGHSLMDAIRQRAFEMNISMRDLDEACQSGAALRRWSPARKIGLITIQRALKVLDGQFTIVWEPLRDNF
jgi:antitoxin component of RelBE/YafQ-DinJ toxin-antitoxin module